MVLLTIGVGAGLAGAELLIRVTNGARYSDRPTFQPRDSLLGWAPAADLDHVYYGGDYSIRVATDEYGNRLGRLGGMSDAAPRVVLLGDSYTFGWGVSTHETYASQLEEILAPRALRVANLGVGGYGTLQSALRLEDYLRSHPGVPIRAVIVLHSHNDPADNVTFASVRRGLRQYVDRQRNTGIHLHNLLRVARRSIGEHGSGTAAHTLPGGYRDFLWTVATRVTDAGRRVHPVGETASGRDEELMSPEQQVIATYERGSLTRLQRDLLRQSLDRVHRLAAELDAHVLHATIHTAPGWYSDSLRESVETSANGAPGVSWCGRIPADDEYRGPVENDHSGRHFTPQLNGYYATKLAIWLDGCD